MKLSRQYKKKVAVIKTEKHAKSNFTQVLPLRPVQTTRVSVRAYTYGVLRTVGAVHRSASHLV